MRRLFLYAALWLLLCGTAAAQMASFFPGPGMPPSSGSAGGGIGVVSHTSLASGPNGATSSAIDTTGANLIVVSCAYYNPFDNCALSDNKSNTYTLLNSGSPNSQWISADGFFQIRVWYLYSPTVGSSHTFTFTCNSGCYPSGQI